MPKANFSAALIADLKSRVISHNGVHQSKVKLGELKKIYERAFKGEAPAERAMRKVDEHLAGLSKAFNPDQPRDKDGKFTGGGDDQSAAAAAAESAKRAAHHAAYIAGFTEAPLKRGVKAPKRSPLGLPADRDVHRALQAENAGYAAFSSSAIPEFRGELAGSILTPALAVTGGAVLAHAVLSNNPRNLPRRGATKIPAYAAGKISRLAVAAGTVPMAFAARKAHDILGLKADASAIKARGEAIGKMTDRQVHDSVRRALNAAFSMSHAVGRPLHDAIVGPQVGLKPSEAIPKGTPMSVPVARKIVANGAKLFGRGALRGFRRSLAGGAAVAVPAYFINEAISGSTIDPENIGAAYDKYSYRIVRKVMDMPELDQLQKVISGDLRKAAFGEELNSGIERLLPKVSRAAVSSLGSLAGAGAGAATGAAGQAVANALNKPRGNPYRDKDGKFTSEEDAVNGGSIRRAALIGAGVGAALGGGTTHLRLAGHNRGLFREAMDRLDNHVQALGAEADVIPSQSTVPEIQKIESERFEAYNTHKNSEQKFLAEKMAEDKPYHATLESVDKYGPNNPHYFVQKIHDQINKHIGELSGFSHFASRIRTMKPEEFAEAIKDFPAKQRDTLLEKFKMREDAEPIVAAALKAHQAKIDDAIKDVEAKNAALEAAGEAKDAARFDHEAITTEGPEKEAAAKAFEDSIKANKSAATAHVKAKNKLDELRNQGVEVRSPLDQSVIAPPTEAELHGVKQDATRAARERAKDAFIRAGDKINKDAKAKSEKAKGEYLANLKVYHNSEIAAFVHKGRRAGALPRVVGRNVEPLLRAKVDHDAAVGKLAAAEKAVSEAKGFRVKAQAQVKGKNASDPVKQKALADAKKAEADAEKNLSEVQNEHNKAVGNLRTQADAFSARYQKFRTEAKASKTHAILDAGTRSQMLADLKRASHVAYDPIGRYAIDPTAKRLQQVMDYVKPRGTAVGNQLKAGGKKALRTALLRPYEITQPDGSTKTEYMPDPLKLGFIAASGAGAEALNYLRQTRDYARERVKGNTKARLPSNLKVELRRHPTKQNDGLFAVHAADPRNKGERIVLFGHRYEEGKAEPINLNPGAKLSDVLNQANSNKNGGGGGGGNNANRDASWLDGKAKTEIDASLSKIAKEKKTEISGGGVSVSARHGSENEHNNSAGNYMSAFRAKFADKKSHSDSGALYKGLDELFSSKQSAILKPGQYHQILTGYKPNEGKKGDGIFANNEDFGSNDPAEVQGALESTVNKIMQKMPPANGAQRDNLKRAVAVIGNAKKVPADDLKPIYDTIGGKTSTETESVDPAEYTSASFDLGDDLADEAPRSRRAGDEFEEAAKNASKALAPAMGLKGETATETLPVFIAHYAAAVDQVHHFGAPVSTMIVRRALEQMTKDGPGAMATRQAFAAKDHKPFSRAIAVQVKKHLDADSVKKADFVVTGRALDNFEALAKAMPAVNQQNRKAASGNPVKAQAFKIGADAARNFEPRETRGIFRAGQRAASAAVDPASQPPVYHPVKDSVAAAADLLGGGAINEGLKHLPSVKGFGWTATPDVGVKQVFNAVASPVSSAKAAFAGAKGVGGAAKATGGILADGLKLGAKGLLAGAVGAGLYSGVQAATGGNSYRRNTTPGQSLGLGLGNFAGNMAGEAAGGALVGEEAGSVLGVPLGPAGVIIGGAAGGALGEFLTQRTMQHFAGYNPKAVSRVMATKVTPAPGQEKAATAGEVGGGVIGNAIGGAGGEGLGGAIGSSIGILSAKLNAPANPSLSGRPKAGALS